MLDLGCDWGEGDEDDCSFDRCVKLLKHLPDGMRTFPLVNCADAVTRAFLEYRSCPGRGRKVLVALYGSPEDLESCWTRRWTLLLDAITGKCVDIEDLRNKVQDSPNTNASCSELLLMHL